MYIYIIKLAWSVKNSSDLLVAGGGELTRLQLSDLEHLVAC